MMKEMKMKNDLKRAIKCFNTGHFQPKMTTNLKPSLFIIIQEISIWSINIYSRDVLKW